ncbi:hypothetical protein GCM10023318_10860 [Nocardia callitridis]|uniref:Uncharacterized protein n=2 Tax=Nocardia callitridis TaxID=648753 RepID=A0ABP9JVV7_9NOCA
MDQRQSAAEAAVLASDQISPERAMARRWETLRAQCYAAATAYLTLTEEMDAAKEAGTSVADGRRRADGVARQLHEAARGVDQFYLGNQEHLEHAVAMLATVPQLVRQVQAEAVAARERADQSPYARYPSVRAGAAAVDEVMITLAAAGNDDQSVSASTKREQANRLQAATRQLDQALAAAPTRAHAAQTALTSVSTRLSAVRTRSEGLAAAFSALLREFNAASSADLANNERESERATAAAEEALGRARAAAANDDPETALDLTTAARGHIGEAEEYVDAVTKRLALLREVRADPQEKSKAVRFRLRDAQMLAVSRGLVADWGSVLDAQVERIDRIAETLTGRHPDYLAYVTELDTVTDFIAGVVDRMRKQAGQQRD